MKIFINTTNWAIVKTENEFPSVVGDNYVDTLKVYYDVNPSTALIYPTITLLKPNGRKVGAFPFDAGTVENPVPFTYTDADSNTWYGFAFTLSSDDGQLTSVGRYQVTITTNKYKVVGTAPNESQVITNQRNTNIQLEVMNAVLNDNSDILILGDDPDEVVASLYTIMQSLQTSVGSLSNSKANKAETYTKPEVDAKDTTLQLQINVLKALENLSNIVSDYAALEALITIGQSTDYALNAKVQVLSDSNYDNNSTLYNLETLEIENDVVVSYSWRFVGYYDGYTKEQIDNIISDFEQSVNDNFDELSGQVEAALDTANETISTAIANINQPTYYDTSNLPTTDVGLVVGSDGYIYSWNGSAYVSTSILYQTADVYDKIKTDVSYLEDDTSLPSVNKLRKTINTVAVDFGGMNQEGQHQQTTSTRLAYTLPISVYEGDILYSLGTYSKVIRYVTAYSNGVIIGSKGANNTSAIPYIVPEGVDEVVLSLYLDVESDLSSIPNVALYTSSRKLKSADFLTPEMFGAVGDGVTDDTTAIQTMFNSVVGGEKIVFNKTQYLITNEIVITTSNLDIDCNFARFIWNNTEHEINAGSSLGAKDRYHGLFTFLGSEGQSFNGTTSTPKIIRYSPSEPMSVTHWNDQSSGKEYQSTLCSRAVLISASNYFSSGDFVHIHTPHKRTSYPHSANNFYPDVDIMTRVIDTRYSDNVIFDYYSPFDFSQYGEGALDEDGEFVKNMSITKITPIENITIKNLIYENITPYTYNVNEEFPETTRNKGGCVIGVKYGRNITVENVTAYKNQFPTLMCIYSYNIKGTNISAYNPKFLGDGAGYTVHMCGCMNANLYKIYGEKCNSVVDFSYSAFCSLKEGKCGLGESYKAFGTHGICEHNITFEDVYGIFGFANGIAEYTCAVANITLIKCECEIRDANGFTDNLNVRDSVIYIKDEQNLDAKKMRITKAKFDNCKIYFGSTSGIMGLNRGVNILKTIIFDNCYFIPSSNPDTIPNGLLFTDFDSITISNCQFNFDSNKSNIRFSANNTIRLIGNDIEDALFIVSNSSDLSLFVTNNHFKYNSNYSLEKAGILWGTLSGVSSTKILLTDNVFENNTTRVVFDDSYGLNLQTNYSIIGIIKNNVINNSTINSTNVNIIVDDNITY